MAGVHKGYKQAETHRLRVQIARKRVALRRLDERYAVRYEELNAALTDAEASLVRAEVREKAAAAKAVQS